MKATINNPRVRWFAFGFVLAYMFKLTIRSDREEFEMYEVKCKVKIDSIRAWKYMTDTTVDNIFIIHKDAGIK